MFMSYSGKQVGKNAEMFREMVRTLGPKFDITVTSCETEDLLQLIREAQNMVDVCNANHIAWNLKAYNLLRKVSE